MPTRRPSATTPAAADAGTAGTFDAPSPVALYQLLEQSSRGSKQRPKICALLQTIHPLSWRSPLAHCIVSRCIPLARGGQMRGSHQWRPKGAQALAHQKPPHKQGAIGPKGVEGEVPASVPPGVFWSKSSKITRSEPTNASKGYSGPPESIPMVSRTFDV